MVSGLFSSQILGFKFYIGLRFCYLDKNPNDLFNLLFCKVYEDYNLAGNLEKSIFITSYTTQKLHNYLKTLTILGAI